MASVDFLKSFDSRQLFRLFVDGRFHTKYRGWKGYEEHEPGSVAGMLKGYCTALDNFDLSGGVTLDYIKSIHKACMSDVKVRVRTLEPGEFRYLPTGFLFRDGNLTPAGLAEIYQLRRDDCEQLFNDAGYQKNTEEITPEEVLAALSAEKKLRYRPWHPSLTSEEKAILESASPPEEFARLKTWVQDQIGQRGQAIIDQFNRLIGLAKDDHEKLIAIARLIRDMELLHPFPDGNCRTLATVMLNHLLMYLDMPPSILFDPNLDAQYSLEEFASEIHKGIESTKRLIADPEAKEYGYRISDASCGEISEFLVLAAELIYKIKSFPSMDYKAIGSGKSSTGDDSCIYLTPEILARVTGGTWLNCDPGIRFQGAATVAPNSKKFPQNSLYFPAALKDWQTDGKNLLDEMHGLYKKGASALVLDDAECASRLGKPVLLVKNASKALEQAAVAARKEVGCKTVLVTGTVGKTGAKVQLHNCLKGQTQVHAVLNSANTRGPVLVSLANLKAGHQVEINEMSLAGGGTSIGVGRSRIVRPNICFYTNIGPNHMDNHGTIENLVEAKAAAVEGLTDDGICIINSLSDYYEQMVAAIRRRRDVPIFTYGPKEGDSARVLGAYFDAQTMGWNVIADIEGIQTAYYLPMVQQHAPVMSAGILLCVKRLGYDVRAAARDYREIADFETMGQIVRVAQGSGSFLFYDQSRRGGIQGVRSSFNDIPRLPYKGRLIAVIGSIGTRVDDSWTQAYHRELAQLINASRIDRLYTTGPFLNYMNEGLENPGILVKHSDDLEELAQCIKEEIRPDDLLFITGSAYLYLGRLASKVLKFGTILPAVRY